MAYKIDEIEGIGPAFAQKLQPAGIRTTSDLLKHCATGAGRRTVSERTGLSERQLLEWVNLADLMRIKGIGSEFSELLEAAGVDTVKELRNRNPVNLAQQLREVNAAKRLSRATPGVKSVERWVAEAARLDPVVSH